jgi:hypothetical protein
MDKREYISYIDGVAISHTVDNDLENEWLDRLNRLYHLKLISICSGHNGARKKRIVLKPKNGASFFRENGICSLIAMCARPKVKYEVNIFPNDDGYPMICIKFADMDTELTEWFENIISFIVTYDRLIRC